MTMELTKKNHINPCFWTALWNPTYFNNFVVGNVTGKAREQLVYSLEIKTPKILRRKVKDIHYVEGLGLTNVNKQEFIELGNVHSPKTKLPVDKSTLESSSIHIIDIENHFTALEEIGGYPQLLDTVKSNQINTRHNRIYLACFVIIHQIRSIKFFEGLFLKYKDEFNPKLKAFIHFKKLISNTDKLYNVIKPIVESKWTLYTTDKFTFPLSDSPIIYYRKLIWVVLSPKHLLEIDSSQKYNETVKYEKEIKSIKFSIFRKQLIRNTFQSIIFSDKETLEKWRKSKTWHLRKHFLLK
jgi:hypothetical protein